MNRPLSVLLATVTLVALVAAATPPAAAAPVKATASTTRTIPDVPYERFTLANGLTVLVHEDDKAPIVAVNVWYHVGSKNEKPGKTGFAHLFEHLMFNGSRALRRRLLQGDGAGRRHRPERHHQRRPHELLPERADVGARLRALCIESDRMGHLLGAIDQGKLDEQRGVVQNEKRQGENQPYGRVWNLISPSRPIPAGHPYSWHGDRLDGRPGRRLARRRPGVVQDLLRPEQRGARDRRRRRPSRTAKEKVERYFGDIPPGPPIGSSRAWIAEVTGEQGAVLEDRVPQARIYKVWNVPPVGTPDVRPARPRRLGAVRRARPRGSTSASSTTTRSRPTSAAFVVRQGDRQASSMVDGHRRSPAATSPQVERAIDEELARFLERGPTAEELERARTAQLRRAFVRGVERIGGFGGKSDVLAAQPGLRRRPRRLQETSPDAARRRPEPGARDRRDAGSPDGVYVLEVHPFPKYETRGAGADRSKLPSRAPRPPRRTSRPSSAASSRNGLKLLVGRAPRVPVVELNLLVDSGYAADAARRPGTARARRWPCSTKGPTTRSALEISDELDRPRRQSRRPAPTSTAASVSLSALEEQPRRLARALRRRDAGPGLPGRPTSSGSRSSSWRRSSARRSHADHDGAARPARACSTAPTTPTRTPFTGSGTEESVAALTREQTSSRFHDTWFKPNNATLIVVGDTTLAEIRPKLEKLFARLEAGRGAEEERGAGRDPPRSRRLPHRPARVAAVGDHRRRSWRRRRANPDEIAIEAIERRARRRLHLAPQHEPARGQALVLRRPHGVPSTRAASGPSSWCAPVQARQDEGGGGRDLEGARGDRRRRGRSPPTSSPRPRPASR